MINKRFKWNVKKLLKGVFFARECKKNFYFAWVKFNQLFYSENKFRGSSSYF